MGEFKNRSLDKTYPFIMTDAMYIKVREDHRIRSKALMIVIGIDADGRKEVLGFELCETETEPGWEEFLKRLKDRGLSGVAEQAMEALDDGFMDAMNIMNLPYKYRQTLRTSNLLERENQELRKREKVIKVFPNAESAIRLMGAVLMDDHDDWSAKSRVFSMKEYFQEREALLFKLRAS